METILIPAGFRETRAFKTRDDGFFRTNLESEAGVQIFVSGSAGWVKVAIYIPEQRRALLVESVRDLQNDLHERLRTDLGGSVEFFGLNSSNPTR